MVANRPQLYRKVHSLQICTVLFAIAENFGASQTCKGISPAFWGGSEVKKVISTRSTYQVKKNKYHQNVYDAYHRSSYSLRVVAHYR